MQLFQCVRYGAGESDGTLIGTYQMRETPKARTFYPQKLEVESDPRIGTAAVKLLFDPRPGMTPWSSWGDGTFTTYPKQAGTPYVFTPCESSSPHTPSSAPTSA